MYKLKEIAEQVYYVGVNDRQKALFEGMWPLPYGVSYNAYLIVDEKTALIDTVDVCYADVFLKKVADALQGRPLDYLIVDHMEPDHAGSIRLLRQLYPNVQIVGNSKTFGMLEGFHGIQDGLYEVKDGDQLSLGRHQLSFHAAPMVHWPEVMVTYDATDKILFSADAFGTYGTLDGAVIDQDMNTEHYWEEMIRYYANIVGKYGAMVQQLLKKAATLDIQRICPLHGPVLDENLGYYIATYDTWSKYEPEDKGVFIAYCSIYGNTAKAALALADILREQGERVSTSDIARDDLHEAVEDAFRYDRLVLCSPTYDGGIMPIMEDFISHLRIKTYQNRKVAFVENGTWAPAAGKKMKEEMEAMKHITIVEPIVTVESAVKAKTIEDLKVLADALLA